MRLQYENVPIRNVQGMTREYKQVMKVIGDAIKRGEPVNVHIDHFSLWATIGEPPDGTK